MSDLGPYVGFFIALAFLWFLLWISIPDQATLISLAMLTTFFFYVMLCTAKATAGRKLAGWQRGLVRLPLILAGAGRTPVPNVKGTSAGRIATVIAIVIAIALLLLTIGVGM